jgi:hypothetical protein
MGKPLITSNAMLRCSFGLMPQPLMVLPVKRVTACGLPVANIQDSKPLVNVPSFGMCRSTINPTVIAATAAALGTPTPAPCVPVTTGPWQPGAQTVTVAGLAVVDSACKLACAWGGVISVQMAAQMAVKVP